MTHTSAVPAFSARPGPADFFQGLALLGKAWRLIFQTPRLLRLSAICAAVTLVALGGLFALLWVYTPELLGWLWARPATWYGQALWSVLLVLMFVVLLVVGAN